MPKAAGTLIYTKTDEAPALATYALLPIIRAFAAPAGVNVETRDISLAGRILANFSDLLPENQRVADALAELGELAKTPDANIIKLPNISASIPQLQAAIRELQAHGYALPDYPEDAKTPEAKNIQARYAKVLGSAVNPVLREGNSDRRVAAPVKADAQKHPHSMGKWLPTSKTHVAHMQDGDFYGSEQSYTMPAPGTVRIELVSAAGVTTVLKDGLKLEKGEVIDASVMQVAALRKFLAEQMDDAKEQGVLFSLHMKATMMKVSDPIMFGHAVTVFFEDVFTKYADVFAQIGANPNNGMGDVLGKIAKLPADQKAAIEADIQAVYAKRAPLAMVDSSKGITNLHVPSDVIIDASMPAAIRAGGKMWGPDGKEHDMKAVIPDRCYASTYQETIRFCRENGAFDVATMGNVCNVGLMAKKAEEYGSHDKTFEIPAGGTVRVVDAGGSVLMQHAVAKGDIWRMCQTKEVAIRDWVKLAVRRGRDTGAPVIFWLDAKRAHDAQLIKYVEAYLPDHDTKGLDIQILPPEKATWLSCERAKAGLDTISVTGNVLRDYLTDLFPILELGTSAKMLSIVPLLAGGGLFETGAGGSAPKHVQQFEQEGHLRWDSLGEYLALGVSLEAVARTSGNPAAKVIGDALNEAIGTYLTENRGPSRKVNELDNRGSSFYLALYWAQALAKQTADAKLAAHFAPLAASLTANEATIVAELNDAQGAPQDIGGYYQPDDAKAFKAMCPSATLNAALAALQA